MAMAVSPLCRAQRVGTNFTGITETDLRNFGFDLAPPDTDGSVGLNHYVSFTNGAFAVYNKTTGAAVTPTISDSSFWVNAGISNAKVSSGVFDPRIIFDQGSQRWFATQLTGENTGNSLLIARSNTSDPTQGFKAISITAANNSAFADFDTLGVNHDSVQIGTNNFGNMFTSQVISIPKADLLLNTPVASNSGIFANLGTDYGFSPQSATDFGASNGHASIVAASQFDPATTLQRYNVNGSGAAGANTSNIFVVNTQSYTTPSLATQPNATGTQMLDSGDTRIGAMVYKVGDNIYLVHGTDVGGRAGIRWTILSDSTNQVVREGTISDPNHDYIMPSIAANSAGNIVIGFTRVGETEFASAYAVTGVTDASGNVTFGGPLLLKAGTVTYASGYDPNFGFQRWGDYSATGVDPSNPNSFWTTQEFCNDRFERRQYLGYAGVSDHF